MIAKEEFTLHFEHPFKKTEDTVPNDVMQDNQFIWVSGTGKVHIYQMAFAEQKNEYAYTDYDEINTIEANVDTKIVKILDVTVPEGTYWICRSSSHAYVTNKLKFDKITKIDLSTREIIEVINCPTGKVMNSNLICESGKLWMVDSAKEDQVYPDRQYLYHYDVNAKVWGAESIPTKKQKARAMLTAGNDGYVYVTNFNNVSIAKFDAQTTFFSSLIRTNAFPQSITASTNREVMVGSFGGMVTRVDGVAETAHNDYSSLGTAISLACHGSDYVWFAGTKPLDPKVKDEDKTKDAWTAPTIDGAASSWQDTGNNDGWPVGTKNPADDFFLGRLNRSNNEVFFTGLTHKKLAFNFWFDDKEDWNIEPLQDTDKITNVFVTLPFTLTQFNGTSWYQISVVPHLIFFSSTSKLTFVKLDHEFARKNSFEVTGQSMVSTGSEDYMGDVGSGELDQ